MTADGVSTILAFVPNWLGDAAMCTPALRALHRRFPETKITPVGRPVPLALLDGLPYLSGTQVLPDHGPWSETRRVLNKLREKQPDLAVVFPHSFRAALFAWMTGAKRRIGQARNGRSFLLTDTVQPKREGGRIKPVYMPFEYLELVAPLGCSDDAAGLGLCASDEAVARVREVLPGDRPRIGIAPGAEWETKRWTAEGYAAVADALTERIGAVCALLTGPKESVIHDAICNAANSDILRCDGGQPTVDTLKATISELDLLVCNDSGARHVAVAFDVPTVCIMGPTSPDYSTGPYERGEILQEPVDCGPCQKPTCATGDHRCMTAITPDRVIDAVLAHLPARR